MDLDPDETLNRLRELAKSSHCVYTRDGEEAMQLFTALDEWLSNAGFLPNDWE